MWFCNWTVFYAFTSVSWFGKSTPPLFFWMRFRQHFWWSTKNSLLLQLFRRWRFIGGVFNWPPEVLPTTHPKWAVSIVGGVSIQGSVHNWKSYILVNVFQNQMYFSIITRYVLNSKLTVIFGSFCVIFFPPFSTVLNLHTDSILTLECSAILSWKKSSNHQHCSSSSYLRLLLSSGGLVGSLSVSLCIYFD